jgi:hypothetical protein
MPKLEPLDIVDNRTPFQKWVDGDGNISKPTHVYVASSWRNPLQQAVVGVLRVAGIPHYDFRNPGPGKQGFSWSEIDPGWREWSPKQWNEALRHPIAKAGFKNDFDGMNRSDCCILVLPCGRSAHLEAGYMAGQGKPVFTLCLDKVEPDLMNLLLGPPSRVCTSRPDLFDNLAIPF